MKKLIKALLAGLTVLLLVGCGNGESKSANSSQSKDPVFLTLSSDTVRSENGKVKMEFKTNPGAKYAFYDMDAAGKKISSGTTASGSVTVNGTSDPGTVKIKVTYKGKSASKNVKIVANAAQSESSSAEKTITPQGKEAVIGNTSSGDKYFGLKLVNATKNFDAHGQGLINSDIAFLAITTEKSVQFTFVYTNYGITDGFLPRLQDFTVYGPDNQAAKIVSQQEGQDKVSEGRSGQTTFWANFNKAIPAGTKVQIEYKQDEMANPLIFETTVQ